jgi:zinc protease
MSKRLYILYIGIALLCVAFIPASAVEIEMPEIEKTSLDNGLDVYVIEQHETPVVTMKLVIPGGSIYENDETAGLANLMSGLLRKGTTSRTANEISEEIDFVGGRLGASADKDAFYVSSTVLSKHLEIAFDLMSDISINPVFDDEEVERLRNQIVGAIEQSKNDPTTIRDQQFAHYLYGDHPYGLPFIGNSETMLMLTSDDIKEYYHKYFIPNDGFLLVVGDVEPKDVFNKAKKYFGKWKAGTPVTVDLPSMPQINGYEIYLIDKPDATQSYISIGHRGIDRYNPDAFSLRVMNYILGGGGFASRLTKEVRGEGGLTYGIGSSFDYNRYPGAFKVTTFTKNESTAEAIDLIFAELEKIRDSRITEEELDNTQSFYTGYIPLQFETPANIANYIETILLYELGEDYYNRYLQGIESTTREDVQEVAQNYIDPDNMLIVVVGKREDVEPQLQKYGDVTVIDMIEL